MGTALMEMRNEFAALRHEVATLRRDFARCRPTDGFDGSRGLPEETTPDDAGEMTAKGEDISVLKTEIRALAMCINKTKSEIAAIRPAQSGDDHIVIVSNELDTIVVATENATQAILDSVESVDALVQDLRLHVSDPYVSCVADIVLEKLVSVLEACNFQDITGQRITKVVHTLKYIEDRVNSMIAIWGGVHGEAAPKRRPDTDESNLLNGPQLVGEGCSQNDIDRMFE